MKYIAFITDGESQVRYAKLTDENMKLMLEELDQEGLEPNFVEVNDPQVIEELESAIKVFIESKGAYLDEHGNTFFVEHEDDSLTEWNIIMQ